MAHPKDQGWRFDMHQSEEQDFLNNIEQRTHIDYTSYRSTNHDHLFNFDDHSVDSLLSNPQPIDETFTRPTDWVPNNEAHGENRSGSLDPFSSSDQNGAITPTEFDFDIVPTPIDPHLDQQTTGMRKSFENLDIDKEREELRDKKAVDELLANEMNKLSFQERETIYDEIHGIDVRNAEIRNESPELLLKSLELLDAELQKLRPEYAAWDRSQILFGSTTYLNSEETRLMFLRCDRFDSQKAAHRLCNYTELVLEIYGEYALQRHPRIGDLSDFELQVLKEGGYQVLPGRDRAGRRIIANLAFDGPQGFGIRSRLRLGVLMMLSMLEDIETQRKGAVAFSWWHNVTVDDFIIRKKVHEKIKFLPMRVGAFHCCIPSESKSARGGKKTKENDGGLSPAMAQIVKAMFIMGVGSELRPHLRFHTGSAVECLYTLQSFGIDPDQVTISSASGTLKIKNHLKWLEFRRMKEEDVKLQGKRFDRVVECPMQTDVLFGRGRPIMKHPGNAVLRNIVQMKLEEYSNAQSKKETTDLTWGVVRTMKGKHGARFLKEEILGENVSGWVEVSNDVARQKVRIAFRDLRTRIMKINSATEANSTNDIKIKRKGETASPILTPPLTSSSTIAEHSSECTQENDSSTSVFLGMDGNNLKRQRVCF